MMRFFSRMTGEVLQGWQREEISARRSLESTMMVSGYFLKSQRGGVQEGVQRMLSMPAAYSLSTTSCSQEKSNSPSLGSILLQANSPMRATLTPAACMRSMSLSTSLKSHSSG